MKIENLSSAEKKLIDKNNRIIGKAIHKYNLIEEGDRIAIGISGGKDSFILLESLALRLKYFPVKFSLFPVHVKIEQVPYSIDENYVKKICTDMGIDFYVRSLSIDFDRGEKMSPCFVCSWNRRKELFKFCREHNCNKLALGHHLDDAIQTLIMNLIFQGSISSMPPDLKLFNGNVSIIRPLLLVPEKNLIDYAKVREYPKEKKMCPYSNETSRNSVKSIINEMEKLNPQAKNSIFAAMANVHSEYLPIEKVDKFGEPL